MKNRKFVKYSILGLLPAALALGVFSGTHFKEASEVNGYNQGSLPTTIDLNSTSESTIRSYYSSVKGKKGNDLLSSLKTVLSNGQVYYSYDISNGANIWKAYEITDRDWEKSPASEITGYDSSTNKITNYSYKTTDPYVHALYVNRDAENPKTAYKVHNGRDQEACIEREHIWPKSFGFDNEDDATSGARGDLMHLWAADGYTNGTHNNNVYGYVDPNKITNDCGEHFDFTSGNYLGKSLTFPSYSKSVFEPQDSDKGDIARACFYMAARYNNISGTDNNINVDNPNLLLSNSPTSTVGTSTSSQAYSLGFISDLLEWNKIDPVDDYEIHRNDLLYKNFTKNRNPFIDFPQWADIIWGDKSGTATPSTDVLNGYTGEARVTGISITTQPSKTSYIEGETFDPTGMVVTASYSDGTSRALISSEYTLSINRALQYSDKSITVSFERKTAIVSITVEAKEKLAEITFDFSNIEDFSKWGSGYAEHIVSSDRGGSVTFLSANKQNGTITDIPVVLNSNFVYVAPQGYQIKSFELTCRQWGTKAKTISLLTSSNYGTTFSSTDVSSSNFTLSSTFSDRNINGLKFDLTTPKESQIGIESLYIEFYEEEKIHPESVTLSDTSLSLFVGSNTKLFATVLPENANNKEVTWSSNNPTKVEVDQTGKVTAKAAGSATITVTTTDGGKTATCLVTAYVPTVTAIEVSDPKTTFNVGGTFSFEGTVTAYYSDGSEVDVTESCTFSGYNLSVAGPQTVTVSFGGKTDTYQITVKTSEICTTVYEKISSLADIESGKKYILGYEDGAVLKAMPNGLANNTTYKMGDLAIANNQVVDEDSNYCVSFENVVKSPIVTAIITNGTKYIANNNNGTGVQTTEEKTNAASLIFTINNGTFKIVAPGERILMANSNNSPSTIGYYSATNVTSNNYRLLSIYKETLVNCETFCEISNPDDLRTGDKILMVGRNQNSCYTASISEQEGSFISVHSISLTNGMIVPDDSTQIYEIVREGDEIAFYDNSLEEYISTVTSGTDNFLGYSPSINDNCLFGIEKVKETNQFEIKADGQYTKNRLLFNSGSTRFSCYGASSNMANMYIYKSTIQSEADSWSKSFLTDTIHCHLDNWSAWSTSYNALSTSAKELLEDATYIDRFDTDMSWRAQAAARYDFLLEEFGLTPFINGRGETSSRPSIISKINEIPTTTLVAIIVGAVGVSAIGGYFFYKKRKEGRI